MIFLAPGTEAAVAVNLAATCALALRLLRFPAGWVALIRRVRRIRGLMYLLIGMGNHGACRNPKD
jgi:hypothetical protein